MKNNLNTKTILIKTTTTKRKTNKTKTENTSLDRECDYIVNTINIVNTI